MKKPAESDFRGLFVVSETMLLAAGHAQVECVDRIGDSVRYWRCIQVRQVR